MTMPPGPPPGPPSGPPQGPPTGPPEGEPVGYWYGYGPPPPGYIPPPPGYRPPPPSNKRISVGMVFVGPVVFTGINFVVFLGSVVLFSGLEGQFGFRFMAVVLALIAFGGGGLLLSTKSPDKRGLGVGLMVGWALMSLFTAGFCTGLSTSLLQL